jgi:hypothetical protein
LAYSLELLARILGVAIEHALAIKLLAPDAERTTMVRDGSP